MLFSRRHSFDIRRAPSCTATYLGNAQNTTNKGIITAMEFTACPRKQQHVKAVRRSVVDSLLQGFLSRQKDVPSSMWLQVVDKACQVHHRNGKPTLGWMDGRTDAAMWDHRLQHARVQMARRLAATPTMHAGMPSRAPRTQAHTDGQRFSCWQQQPQLQHS